MPRGRYEQGQNDLGGAEEFDRELRPSRRQEDSEDQTKEPVINKSDYFDEQEQQEGAVSADLKAHEESPELPHALGSVKTKHLGAELRELLGQLGLDDEGNIVSDRNFKIGGDATIGGDLTLDGTLLGDLTVGGDITSNGHSVYPVEHYSSSVASAGWRTIAYNNDDRASAHFVIKETQSGSHQTVHFYAAAHYGKGFIINVVSNSYYGSGKGGFRYIRILGSGTYDGAALQVYCDRDLNNVEVFMDQNYQSSGWQLIDWTTDTYGLSEKVRVDLDNTDFGSTSNVTIGGILNITKETDGVLRLARGSGNASIIPYGSETWLIMDGNGSLGLNYYASGNVIIANGGGNVGIGTTSPTQKLHVNGNTRVGGQLDVDSTAAAFGNSSSCSFYTNRPRWFYANTRGYSSAPSIGTKGVAKVVKYISGTKSTPRQYIRGHGWFQDHGGGGW